MSYLKAIQSSHIFKGSIDKISYDFNSIKDNEISIKQSEKCSIR